MTLQDVQHFDYSLNMLYKWNIHLNISDLQGFTPTVPLYCNDDTDHSTLCTHTLEVEGVHLSFSFLSSSHSAFFISMVKPWWPPGIHPAPLHVSPPSIIHSPLVNNNPKSRARPLTLHLHRETGQRVWERGEFGRERVRDGVYEHPAYLALFQYHLMYFHLRLYYVISSLHLPLLPLPLCSPALPRFSYKCSGAFSLHWTDWRETHVCLR